MALLIRAWLSSLDDDDDDATASSPSRSPSPPLVSPTVRRAAVLGTPRIAAQLSSSMDDEEGEVFDDAMDYGEEDEVLQEVPHGFFRVARVPPPSGEDPFSGDEKPAGSASASESEYFAAAVRSLEEGARSGLEDAAGVIVGDKGTGVEGSDGSVLKDGDRQGDQGVGAEAVNDGVAEPFIADARGIDGGAMRVVESLEGKDGGSEHEVAELPPVVNATEDGADLELGNGDSDAKDGTPKHELVMDVEDASPDYVATIDGTSDLLEVPANVDDPHSIADGGPNKVDGETDGDYEASDEPASMPTKDAAELVGKELEDDVPASMGTRFGLDDSDEEEIDDDEVNRKEIELVDYAALADLLRAANRSPGQGKAKVFLLSCLLQVQSE